ncbi:sulfatase, partial [Balneolaceae bacterium YR4-1]|nr:sulfatase [Halalkalibaculum roseum]
MGLLFISIDVAIGQTREKPNVLFIAVDDLKPMIGAYGHDQIQTPQMDKLASEGVTFMNNHTQQAVCGPSRASLLTGWRPDKTKIWRLNVMIRDKNPDVVTLPQHFKNNDYITAGIGKIFDKRSVDKDHDKRSWSLSYRENMPDFYLEEYGEPFVHYQSTEVKKKAQKYMEEAEMEGLNGWERKAYAMERIKPSTEMLDVPDEAYLDGLLAKRGQELLEQLSENEKPFFLGIGFKKPHLPFVAPKKYWDLYNRDDISLSKWQKHSQNGPDLAYHRFGELRSYTDIPPAIGDDGLVNREKQKELIHGYMATVSYIDTQVGKLMDKLDKLGLRENTIVVLW